MRAANNGVYAVRLKIPQMLCRKETNSGNLTLLLLINFQMKKLLQFKFLLQIDEVT